MNNDAIIFKILPTQLRQRLSNYSQFFKYDQRNHLNDDTSFTKVCFQPKLLPPRFNLLANSSRTTARKRTASTKGINFGSKYIELHLYNESMGTMGAKTKFTLPSWIVYKTLHILEEREKAFNANLRKYLEQDIQRCKEQQQEILNY